MAANTGPLADARALVAACVAAPGLSAPPAVRALDLVAEIDEVTNAVLRGTEHGQRPFAPPTGWEGELVDVRCALRCPVSDTGVALDTAPAAALIR